MSSVLALDLNEIYVYQLLTSYSQAKEGYFQKWFVGNFRQVKPNSKLIAVRMSTTCQDLSRQHVHKIFM